MCTILLADDHPLVRLGVRSVLEAAPDLRIIGETGDGLEAVRLAARLQPDVLIADIMMPGLTGLEVVRRVKQQAPRTRTLLLTMYADQAYVLQALHHGAGGYLLKDSLTEELPQAVRAVAGGGRYLSAALSERELELYVQRTASTPLDPYEMLSPREREVLKLSAEGSSAPEIAARLFIGSRTVETHRVHLMRKLGLQNQTDLIRFALRRGLVPLQE